MPGAAGPDFEVVPGGFGRAVTDGFAAELIEPERDRAGDAGGGGFAQDAHGAVVGLVVACGGPEVVGGVDGDALQAGGGHIGGHGGAERVAPLGDDGVDVGVDGVEPRGHEHAGGRRALLVDVVDDLRVPGVV